MIYLADTSVLIYVATLDPRLSPNVHDLLQGPDSIVYASAVSACEIGNKYRIGKLPFVGQVVANYAAWAAGVGFKVIELTSGEALAASMYPAEHRDPFDRLLAAQARHHAIPILSPDTAFDTLGVERIW